MLKLLSILVFLSGLQVFAANEDVIASRNSLLHRVETLQGIAKKRTQMNEDLSAAYTRVKNDPTEANLRSFISLLLSAQRENWSTARHLANLRIHDFGVIPEFASHKMFFQEKLNILEAVTKEDSGHLKTAIESSNGALIKNLQANLAHKFADINYGIQRKIFCQDLPNTVGKVVAKAKWNAYEAVEKKNLWLAELATKKVEVTKVVLETGREICGETFQSSDAALKEAEANIQNTLKSLPRKRLEQEICSNLPQNSPCAKLLANPFFLAYVSQVPKQSLRHLKIDQTFIRSVSERTDLSRMMVFARDMAGWECHGAVCIPDGGGRGGSGGGSEGTGEGGRDDGEDGGSGSDSRGGGGIGGAGREGRGGGGSREDKDQRDRREKIQRSHDEIKMKIKDLADSMETNKDLQGIGVEIDNTVIRSLENLKWADDFRTTLKKSIEIQVDDVSDVTSSFIPGDTSNYYKSPKASEYYSIESKLNRVETPQGKVAREGLRDLLYSAEAARIQGDLESAEYYKDLANELADVGLSLTPGISVGKDAYEALLGSSFVTGEELDGFSRGMAIIGVATVGGGNYLKIAGKFGIKLAGKIVKLLSTENKAASSLRRLRKIGDFEKAVVKEAIELAEKHGVQVNAIYPGKSGEYVIIGRDMNKVREARAALEKHTKVMVFDGEGVISKSARQDWDLMVLEFSKKGSRVPPEVVKSSEMYRQNKKWLNDAILKGHTIIDLGNPFNSHSDFYEMELELLRGLSNIKM